MRERGDEPKAAEAATPIITIGVRQQEAVELLTLRSYLASALNPGMSPSRPRVRCSGLTGCRRTAAFGANPAAGPDGGEGRLTTQLSRLQRVPRTAGVWCEER